MRSEWQSMERVGSEWQSILTKWRATLPPNVLRTAYYILLTTYYLLLTAGYLLLTTDHVLVATY